jgi:1-acyl-sn-glycerol-3-phosphate acyltransferase
MKSYHHNVKNVAKDVHDFFHRTYNAIHVNGPVIDPDGLRDAGLMITCTHRSMADYYLLGMFLHEMGIGNLRFAAGDNLTKLPIIGPKFRAFGAFAIERDGAFKRSYIKRLCEQVVSMIEDNDSIIVFPEGGRSYHGNMLEIKGGVLAAAVVAQARNPQKKILILPIAFTYEHLYELPYFDLLEKGKNFRKRSNPFFKRWLGSILYFGADIAAVARLYINFKLGRKQGDIFIDYAAPLSITDIVDIKANYSPESKDELFAHKNSIQILGEAIRRKLLELYRLLPMHVVAYSVKQHPSLKRSDILQSIRGLVASLSRQNRNTASLKPLSDEQIFETGMKQLSFFKAVTVRGDSLKIIKPSIVDYFAAAI